MQKHYKFTEYYKEADREFMIKQKWKNFHLILTDVLFFSMPANFSKT